MRDGELVNNREMKGKRGVCFAKLMEGKEKEEKGDGIAENCMPKKNRSVYLDA